MEGWFPLLLGAFIILVLGGIGCAIRFGKAYWLISGYNTMPAEKKKNVDAAGLARYMSNCIFAGCALIAAAMLFYAFGLPFGGHIMLALLLPGIVWLIIGAQKFDRNALTADGKFTAKTKFLVVAVIAILAAAGVFVAVLLGGGSRPVEYGVGGGSLEIKGMYGETIPLSDVSGLELVQALPDISMRTNGSAIGDKLRGSFRLKDGTAARIYIENDEPPFIHFERGGKAYYLNMISPVATESLYNQIR